MEEENNVDKKVELTQIIETVQNDMEQFEMLYPHIVNKVYYWCYSIINDESVAKDLTQESMIRIYQKLHTLDDAEAFYSWTYVLVRNICYSYLRKNKKADTSFIVLEEYYEDFENTIKEGKIENLPEEAYNLKETKRLIVSFVEALPRKQKEVIMLFYLEEFTTQEIAEMLNYNIGTVRTCLHYGRKNLAKQIDEYQEKNNIRLYSIILLPLLGSILQEYSEEISDNQNLSYDKRSFKTRKLSKSLYFKDIMAISVISITVVITVVTIVVLFMQLRNNIVDSASTSDLYDKLDENPYVESITYYTFPTRDSTPVLINLKKDVSEKTIEILFGNQEIPFDIKDKVITVIAIQNGEYTMTIDGKKTTFLVDTINQYAPEVTGIREYENYLQLYVNDELEQINYQKSYLLYENKKYQITSDKQVLGSFKGNIVVYIFNDLDQYIYYEFYLK